ncbi:MAG: cytochrome c peroxidase, partial [Hyphomicrobiaceae bacterium]
EVLNFRKRGIDAETLPLVAYGSMLFGSPYIFGETASSLGLACATCHNGSDTNRSFYIPGISHQRGAIDVRGSFFNALFNDHRHNSVDIPSLRGLRFTGPYGRDGRFASLRDFIRNVIVGEFGGSEPSPFMLDALVAYMLEFDFLPNSKLNAQGQLTAKASAAARRGEALFRKPFEQMGGRSCATCHVPSASFLDRKSHNIGSALPGYGGARDGAFDTPTLLGSSFTAPYFHDGRLPTLKSVVAWFNNRYKLELKSSDRLDLVAYLKTVGDADEPYQRFDAENTEFRLSWREFKTFASTFETLLPSRDGKHARLLLKTLAGDLVADAGSMANLPARPKLYELSLLLDKVRESVVADDWTKAATTWRELKRLQARYDADMY